MMMRAFPPGLVRVVEGRPWARTLARILVLLAVFVAVDRLVLRASKLSERSYGEPVLVLELARSIGWPLVLAVLIALIVLARYGALLAPWNAFAEGTSLRAFVVFVAFILVWLFATMEHNFYLDQGHLLDRGLLVGLLVALWFRPLFVLPLVVLLTTLLWQLVVPSLGGSILAHKLQVLHVLNLFAAAWLLHAVTGARWKTEFVFLCCCIVAGAYVAAALAKFELGWLGRAQLFLMPASAYGHGWLDFIGPDGIGEIATWLDLLDGPMQLFVLLVEAGCVLFLVRRWVSIGLLVAVIFFHFGVLALYGFFFWTWILLDAALLGLLLAQPDVLRETGLGLAGLLLSMLLIATAIYWVKPPWLAWFDTGLTYTYRFEAIGESGQRYTLRPGYFAPYDDVFTMTSFRYLSDDHRMLTGAYGVTKSAEIADAIAAARSAEEIFALEESAGRATYSEEKAQRLVRFVSRYLANRNAREERPASGAALKPPMLFISHREGVVDTGSDRVKEIIVREVTTWFDGKRPREIRVLEAARIVPET